MGLMEHLEELRFRLVRSVVAFTIAFFGCWTFSSHIYEFLSKPIFPYLPEGKKLVFLGYADPFLLYMKVAALAGIFLASPVILYQLWSFIAPGLYGREKRMVGPFVFFGSTLFLAGGAFGYYVAFPFSVEFLLGVGGNFEAQITVSKHLSFLMTIILGLGLMFELPTLIFLLAKMGLVTPGFLLRHFRIAVVLIFIAAAIITPTPDVMNLCIFALPTILLYLVGIAVAWIFGPKPVEELDSVSASAE